MPLPPANGPLRHMRPSSGPSGHLLPRAKAIRKEHRHAHTSSSAPPAAGKSWRMLAELRARAERGERSLLIVPEQFTSSTEGHALPHPGGQPVRLRGKLLLHLAGGGPAAPLRRGGGGDPERGGPRPAGAPRGGFSLLDKVVYYNRQRRSAAFCEKAAQTIEELKSAGVTPDHAGRRTPTPAGG